MRILLLDLETGPNTAFTWGLWDQNISIHQLIESSKTLCWSAKWYKEPTIFFDSVYQSSNKKMCKGIHKLMEEADALVHYNGTRFDIPTINKEFLLEGLAPPSPSKQIDLLKVCRRQFKFPSNKLDYVAQRLGLGEKKQTNFKLWVDCMNNDPVAWKKMEAYNKHDVKLLERVYKRVLPWIKGHPSRNVIDGELRCPVCGSNHYQRRGWAYTQSLKYVRLQCSQCASWFRGGKGISKGPDGKFVPL